MGRLGTVAIVGVGLIGGSVGLVLRDRKLAERVVGIGRDPARLDAARRLGAIDEATTDPRRGLVDAEVVVVCTPVTRIVEDVATAARLAAPGALITDAGSTKRLIVEAIERDERSRLAFVGAHPIAGSERKGAAFAREDLFDDRLCVLTPTDRTPRGPLERARSFWTSLGCRLAEMSPEAHDQALALTSHLPHAVAAALAAAIPADLLPLAAGAYRDGTRVAGSDAALWAGIFLANRGPLLAAIETFGRRLEALRQALDCHDEAGLRALWDEARVNRLQSQDADRPEPLPWTPRCLT